MMRGITPILALVLLIAVVTGITGAVYYWLVPYSSRAIIPPEVTEKKIYVEDCNNTHIMIKNTGSEAVPAGTTFPIFSYTTGNPTGCAVTITPTLVQGNITSYAPNCTVPSGTYVLRLTKYTDAYFAC